MVMLISSLPTFLPNDTLKETWRKAFASSPGGEYDSG